MIPRSLEINSALQSSLYKSLPKLVVDTETFNGCTFVCAGFVGSGIIFSLQDGDNG